MLVLIRIIALYPGSFIINTPNANTVWLDGSTNSIEWTLGKEDIKIFDVEMIRFSSSGIKYVAENGQYLVPVLALTPPYPPYPITS